MRVLCVDPSVRPSIHTSVSSSIRTRNTRACSGARACERVLRRRAHTRVHVCIYVCTRANVYMYLRRESASIASRCTVSGHAAHDIRRWGPCGHLISGDTRARASLLIRWSRPLARLRNPRVACQRNQELTRSESLVTPERTAAVVNSVVN